MAMVMTMTVITHDVGRDDGDFGGAVLAMRTMAISVVSSRVVVTMVVYVTVMVVMSMIHLEGVCDDIGVECSDRGHTGN